MNADKNAAAGDSDRAAWLRVLARASGDELRAAAGPVVGDYRFDELRAPQQGLVMIRARIGNAGDRFNLGEATVTRCAVRHAAPDGQVLAGIGYVLGRDAERAALMARMDALLQRDDLRAPLERAVVEPLRLRQQLVEAREQAATQASRVRFLTLQPEAV